MHTSLKCHVIWLPMMPDDSPEEADLEAASFTDLPVTHRWDGERKLGSMFSETLGLKSIAWDVYLLYGPGARWTSDVPPAPEFWMHQLPADSGAARNLVLYPTKLFEELTLLMDEGVEPRSTGREDLGLQLHGNGLMALARDRSEYSREDLQKAFEESKID